MKRKIVVSHTICADGYNKMFLRIPPYEEIPTIHINIDGYNNFYEIIRGLNHEEFHIILYDLFGEWICRELDRLNHIYFDGRLKDVLYELPSKATKQTSIKDLTDSISTLDADDLHFKKFGYHLDLKKFL